MRNNPSIGNYGLKHRFFSSCTKASDDFDNCHLKTETSPEYQFLQGLEDSPFDGCKEIHSLTAQISAIISHNSRSLEQVQEKSGKRFPPLTETEKATSLTLQMKNWLSCLYSQEESISRILQLDRFNLEGKNPGLSQELQTVEQDLLLLEQELKQKNFSAKRLELAIETLDRLNRDRGSSISGISDTSFDSDIQSYPVSVNHSRHVTYDLDSDLKDIIHSELENKSIKCYRNQEDGNKKSSDSFINHLMNDAESLKMHLNSLTGEIRQKELIIYQTQSELDEARRLIESLTNESIGNRHDRAIRKKRNSAPTNYVNPDRFKSSCNYTPVCLGDQLQSLLSAQCFHTNHYENVVQKIGDTQRNALMVCSNLFSSYVSLRHRLQTHLELLNNISDIQEKIGSISFKKLMKNVLKIDKSFRDAQNSLENRNRFSSKINSFKQLVRLLNKHDQKWAGKEKKLTVQSSDSISIGHPKIAAKKNSNDLLDKLDNLDARLSRVHDAMAAKKKPVLRFRKKAN